MEKNNGKMVAIVALVVAVVALSVGFAAFADQLTIGGSATAKAGGNPFDGTAGADLRYTGNGACTTNDVDNENVITGSYSAGTLSEDDWTGISVPLTKEHPSVKCTATVQNASAYTAWLREISTNGGVSCTGGSTGANASTNETNVCNNVTVEVQVGSVSTDKITFGASQPSANSSTTGSISASGTATVTVTITLNNANSIVADEDVTITLPTITHTYSTAQTGSTGA